MVKNLVIVSLILVVGFLGFRLLAAGPLGLFSPPPVAILTAFGDPAAGGSWTGEVGPYMAQLQSPIQRTDSFPYCQSVIQGRISGQSVLVVVTGIGKVSAATCVQNLLSATNGRLKAVIFSGTAGISPSEAMLGDVCINSQGLDFDRQVYSADQPGSTAPEPQIWADSVISASPDSALANHLYSASHQAQLPASSAEVSAANRLYHSTSRPPKVWGPSECLEVSGDLFWHDTRFDSRAIQLAADFLSPAAPPRVMVTAMESAAIADTVDRWNNRRASAIPSAYVRSASNFDRPWTDASGQPAADAKSSLAASYTPASENLAIRTSAAVVLKWLSLGAPITAP